MRKFFGDRFGDVRRSEAWGYAVWSAMGVVIAVPELLAAAGGNNFLWPTISTTVGHLQDRWPVLTLLPVALIVMAGFSVMRIRLGDTALQADLLAIGRSPQGRLIKQDVTLEQLAQGGIPPAPPKRGEFEHVLAYFVFATAVVIAGGVAAAPSDSRFLVGYVLYSLIALFWVVIPNLAAYLGRKDFPFTTLFFTVRALSRRLQFVALLVAALLVILLLHLAFYPWPSRR